MPAHHDELPTLDTADLSKVIGGTGTDMFSTLMPLFLKRSLDPAAGQAPAAQPTATPPWQPTITVDGVPQQLTNTGNGNYTVST